MIPNPIRKVLSSIEKHEVRALLMGGQACVLYGAAEFSRDVDFAVLADLHNMARLQKALEDLKAEVIAVPPLNPKYLRRGHAVHFRCRHPEAAQLRIDVMSKMRGLQTFAQLWKRRTTLILPGNLKCNLMALPDLVKGKKTQRDKDWPMMRRLLEAHYFQNQTNPSWPQIAFWFRELRTPVLLAELARRYPRACRRFISVRPLLDAAASGNLKKVAKQLSLEETIEREKDRLYWLPLRKELEIMRRTRPS